MSIEQVIEEVREEFLNKWANDPRVKDLVNEEVSARFDIDPTEEYYTAFQEEAVCVVQLLVYDRILKALF